MIHIIANIISHMENLFCGKIIIRFWRHFNRIKNDTKVYLLGFPFRVSDFCSNLINRLMLKYTNNKKFIPYKTIILIIKQNYIYKVYVFLKIYNKNYLEIND